MTLLIVGLVLGLVLGFVLGVAFCLWLGSQAEHMGIPKPIAAQVYEAMTDNMIGKEER